MNTLLLSIALACAPGPDGKVTCTGNHAEGEKDHAECAGHAQAAGPGAPKTGEVMTRGEKLKGLPAVTLDKLLTSPTDFEGKDVQVEAKIRKACEKKGCWMELAAAKDGPGVRVTFKDYGFFVPLNSQGSDARVEGEVNVKTIPAAEVAHYEGEGGHFPNKLPDGSAREVRFVASGVALWRLN